MSIWPKPNKMFEMSIWPKPNKMFKNVYFYNS